MKHLYNDYYLTQNLVLNSQMDEAARIIYRQIGDGVKRHVKYRYKLDETDARSVISDVVLNILRALQTATINNQEHYENLCRKITTCVAIKFCAENRKYTDKNRVTDFSASEKFEALAETEPASDETADEKDIGLSEDDRILVRLRANNVEFIEIGEILKRTPNYLRGRYHQLKKKFKI